MPPVIGAIAAGIGAAVTAAGVSGVTAAYITAALTTFVVAAGAGLVLWGIGTLFNGPVQGIQSAARNPIGPWNVQYGRARVGGTVVFINSFGDSDKYLDLVIVLACHPCQSVDALLFDNQKVPFGDNNTSVHRLSPIVNITNISRTGNVVTVTLANPVPGGLSSGDQVVIQSIHPVNDLFNGKFPVVVLDSTHFYYLAGGPQVSLSGSPLGTAQPYFVDYGRKVYMEALLGTQTLGQTFNGMINGTPTDGDTGTLVQNSSNPWNLNCSLVGMTAVFLRLHYNDTSFASGLPQISFLIHGKNNVADYRTSPPTIGYTENAALCIADFLADQTWGFKASYGTEIPTGALNAAANICDEAVALALPNTSPPTTEPRYTCNGAFPLSMRRGEILQNLLTSCAGRLTYTGGQFLIWPAAWNGVAATIAGTSIYSMSAGAFRWKPTVSSSNLFNGVKGTFVSSINNWQPTDFPPYAQDGLHGYTWGSAPAHDQNLDNDGGDRRWLDIQLPFTISPATAQRIAKIELMRRRQQGTGTFALNMAGYSNTPMDVLALDLPYFGWAGKYLEVLDARLKFDQQSDSGADVVLLGTEIDVQETDPSVYFWDIGEELSPAGYQQAIVPDTRTPAAPTNVLLESADNEIIITWTEPDDAYVTNGGHVEVEYQLVQSPEGLWLSLARMDPTITQAVIENLTTGDQYNVRIRAVNAAGVPSDWVLGSPIDTSPLTPGPITVAGSGQLGQWGPGVAGDQAGSTDALFPEEFTFTIDQAYQTLADGSALALAHATGGLPVQRFIPNCLPPILLANSVVVSPTGGSLQGAATIYIQVTAMNSDGAQSLPSNVVPVEIPLGTNTNSISISIIWPPGSFTPPVNRWALYLGAAADLIELQAITHGFSSPITVTDLPNRYASSVPNLAYSTLRLVAKHSLASGVTAPVQVTGISSPPTTITCAGLIDSASPPTDNWTGRVLSCVGRTGVTPYDSYNITGFDPTTGELTLDRGATLQVGDYVVVRTLGYDNSASPTVLEDSGYANTTNGHAGLPDLTGNVVRVIKGTGRGQRATIVSMASATSPPDGNTALNLDGALVIDSTSVWIIEAPTWEYSTDTAIVNSRYTTAVQVTLGLDNFAGADVMLISSYVLDSVNNQTDDQDAAIREMYIYGAQGASGGFIAIDGNTLTY